MSSTSEHGSVPITPSSCADRGLAVQPVDAKGVVPVDGPVLEFKPSSSDYTTLTSEDELSTDVDTGALQSPSQSSRSAPTDDLSDTSSKDSEIYESLLKESSVVHKEARDNQEDVTEAIEEKLKGTDNQPKPRDGMIDATSSVDRTVADASEGDDAAVACPIPACADNVNSPEETPAVEAVRADEDAAMLGNSATNMEDATIITDGEEAVTGQNKPTRSIPPRLCTDLQSLITRQSGLRESQFSTPVRHVDVSRVSRNHVQFAHSAPRYFDAREEVSRLSAQLMKVRNELEAERKKSANMRKSVEEEMQKNMDAALAGMTTDLLNKQFKTLTHQGKVEAMERDLSFRQVRIEQLEVFLSEGQKQVYRNSNVEDDEDEVRLTIAEVNREHDRRQAELQAQKDMADREGKLALRYDGLKLLEEAQEKRERHYQALFRQSIEAEIREKNTPYMETKLNEVADLEYNRGFGAGKAAGRVEAEKEAREQGFLEGYEACRRAEVALTKMRKGLVARDSPELDFVFDAGHPHNIFTMGAKIGGMSSAQDRKPVASSVAPRQVQAERQPIPEQVRVEERVRRAPPPRPTFAAELRGAVDMHNGQHVLANGLASASAASVNGTHGVNEGRPITKHEGVTGDSLIDLY